MSNRSDKDQWLGWLTNPEHPGWFAMRIVGILILAILLGAAIGWGACLLVNLGR